MLPPLLIVPRLTVYDTTPGTAASLELSATVMAGGPTTTVAVVTPGSVAYTKDGVAAWGWE